MRAAGSAARARAYHHGDLRRTLVDAALALVAQEQSWNFSLREVARRASVSHSAPYNHFPERHDLLVAVAVRGFDLLREHIDAASKGMADAEAGLLAAARAYAGFALENPALYRLMFGPELAEDACDPLSAIHEAGDATKACVHAIIRRGAQERIFAVDADDEAAREMFALSCWSTLHGIVMLAIDGKAAKLGLPLPELVEALTGQLLRGLRTR